MTTVAFALTPTPIFLDMAAPGFGMYGTAAVKPISGTFPHKRSGPVTSTSTAN
ncbi:MAG: hypothetical protein IPI41_12255 [Flavobacteriales bacterium]|nr:hypothetical protein [Flavobacteriales bacterium]